MSNSPSKQGRTHKRKCATTDGNRAIGNRYRVAGMGLSSRPCLKFLRARATVKAVAASILAWVSIAVRAERTMRTSILLGLSLCIAFSSAPAVSQDSASGSVRTHIRGIEIAPLANAPFTAKTVVTWNEPPVGGAAVSRKYYTLVARDSQGRVRREVREFIPADSSAEPPLRSFTILDPVSAKRTTCTQASMSCATSAFYPRMPVGDSDGTLSGSSDNVTRESLGQQTIDGLPVVGTRETVSNASSSRVALTQTEVWYSPDLHMDLSVIRSNPQLGEVTLQVTNLVRGEPDLSWFSVPSGYEVKAGPTR